MGVRKKRFRASVIALTMATTLTFSGAKPAYAFGGFDPGSLLNTVMGLVSDIKDGKFSPQKLMDTIMPFIEQLMSSLCNSIENDQLKGLCNSVSPMLKNLTQKAIKGEPIDFDVDILQRTLSQALPAARQVVDNVTNGRVPIQTPQQLGRAIIGAYTVVQNQARATTVNVQRAMTTSIGKANEESYKKHNESSAEKISEDERNYNTKYSLINRGGQNAQGQLGAIGDLVQTAKGAQSELDLQKALAELIYEEGKANEGALMLIKNAIAENTLRQIELAKINSNTLTYLMQLQVDTNSLLRELNNRPSPSSPSPSVPTFFPAPGSSPTN